MIRLVCDPDQRVGDALTLTPEQAHYLERVMRQKPGDVVEVQIKNEGVREATVLGSGQLRLGRPTAARSELPVRIMLYQALLKQDHFAEVVERGTEAGIASFIPLVTSRAIVREVTSNREHRWRKIATEATEQCRRAEVPRILPVAHLKDLAPPASGIGILLDPGGVPLHAIVSGPIGEVGLVVGPEGGFTPDERNLLRTRGFQSVSLGPHVFRAENAGAFATVMILALCAR